MALPTISSITFDKASYAPGDKITATVHYTPGTSGGTGTTQTLTGTATDTATSATGTLTVTFITGNAVVTDPTTVTVTDTGGHTWTPVSDAGGAAVFTTTA